MQKEKENFYFRDGIHGGFFFFFLPSEPRAKETAAIKVLATGAESGIENSVLFGKPFSFAGFCSGTINFFSFLFLLNFFLSLISYNLSPDEYVLKQ